MPGPDGRPTPEEMQAAMANLRTQPNQLMARFPLAAGPQERAQIDAVAPPPPAPPPSAMGAPAPSDPQLSARFPASAGPEERARLNAMMADMGQPALYPEGAGPAPVVQSDPSLMRTYPAGHGLARPTPQEHARFQAMLQRDAGLTPEGAMTPEGIARATGPAVPPTAPPRPPPTAVALKGGK